MKPVCHHFLSTECPLGWYGPGCQSPCQCDHQCPCDPQTGNCSVSQGTGPPGILGEVWGRQTVPKLCIFYLVSYSEAVSPVNRGHTKGRRAGLFHQVGVSAETSPHTPSMRLGICPGTSQARRLQMILYFVRSRIGMGETDIRECKGEGPRPDYGLDLPGHRASTQSLRPSCRDKIRLTFGFVHVLRLCVAVASF